VTRRWVAATAAVVLLAAGLATLALTRPGGPPAVMVAAGDGDEVLRVPLPADGRFELRYVHSVYRAEAAERFAAEPGGGFRLVAIASPSEAVLDYYDVQGARTAEGDRLRLDLAAPQRFERLPLVATTTGRRTLVAGGAQVPLWTAAGPAALVLTIER
jgi:hypothetical protein